MQCGGSDAFSGITANPLLGHLSDILIAAGGSTIFSENTECMDAEFYLKGRCLNSDISAVLSAESIGTAIIYQDRRSTEPQILRLVIS